jgi:hypothetical protein
VESIKRYCLAAMNHVESIKRYCLAAMNYVESIDARLRATGGIVLSPTQIDSTKFRLSLERHQINNYAAGLRTPYRGRRRGPE